MLIKPVVQKEYVA